jgi:hypothetical protein
MGTVYVSDGLTPAQRRLAHLVCGQARSLHDRLRALSQQSWRGAEPADVTAVRGWLFAAHGATERDCRG